MEQQRNLKILVAILGGILTQHHTSTNLAHAKMQDVQKSWNFMHQARSSKQDPTLFVSSLQSLQEENSTAQISTSTSSSDKPSAYLLDDFEDVIDQIGSNCDDNVDCDGSTFCCSKGRCVPGSICYKGQKQAYDHCQYGFECLSRCCNGDTCSPVIECVKTCDRNSDCGDEPCCSFGYCTGSEEICLTGSKEDFDQCESPTECVSGRCTNGRCTSNEIQVQSQLSLNVMIILVFLMLIIVVTTCYFAKIKTEQFENMDAYRRQRNHGEGDLDTNDTTETQRRRRRRSQHRGARSGSSSSERRQRHHNGDRSPGQDSDLLQRGSVRSRGFSDSEGQHSGDKLNKDNLDRLQRQTDSAKRPSSSSGNGRQPALLFVDDHDDQDLINQVNSSYMAAGTNARSSDLVHVVSDKEARTNTSAIYSQDLTASGTEGGNIREKND